MWYVDNPFITADNVNFFADGSQTSILPVNLTGSTNLDVYDNLNGSLSLIWAPFTNVPAGSYNVYVNGVLYANVSGPPATVAGLQIATYKNHVQSPALTYRLNVVAVVNGTEAFSTIHRKVTPHPDSIMLTTPMKRLWPFPNSTID